MGFCAHLNYSKKLTLVIQTFSNLFNILRCDLTLNALTWRSHVGTWVLPHLIPEHIKNSKQMEIFVVLSRMYLCRKSVRILILYPQNIEKRRCGCAYCVARSYPDQTPALNNRLQYCTSVYGGKHRMKCYTENSVGVSNADGIMYYGCQFRQPPSGGEILMWLWPVAFHCFK
jgi:hypothetical protein